MSTTASTENYFILLGLDPDKPWNQAEFDRVVAEKQREWSRLATHQLPAQKKKALQSANTDTQPAAVFGTS